MTDSATTLQTADPRPRGRVSSLRSAALRGSAVTLLGQAGGNFVRLGANLVLTRLLLPEYFGVMTLVNLLLTGLRMFSDIGIGPSIIQNERGLEPAFARTAYSLQVIRGALLATVATGLAWPMAAFYRLPELMWMVPVASLTALIDGFVSTKMFRENRRLHLGRITTIEVLGHASSALTMIVVALATRSIVSLLVGGIVGAAVRVALSHVWLPGFRDGFRWEASSRHALLTFGRWIFLSTAITFVALQVDRIVLGRLVTPDVLGVYSIAAMLAAMPREVVGQLSQRVLYPVVSTMLRGGGDPTPVRTLRIKLLGLLVVPFAVLIGVGAAVVDVLYDVRYLAAGGLLATLSIGTWFSVVSSTYGTVVLAKGWPRWISFAGGAKTLVFFAGVAPVYDRFGVEGVAALVPISDATMVIVTGLPLIRLRIGTPVIDLGLSAATLALGAGVYAAQSWISAQFGSPLPGVLAFAAVAVAVPALGARSMGLFKRAA